MVLFCEWEEIYPKIQSGKHEESQEQPEESCLKLKYNLALYNTEVWECDINCPALLVY